MAARKNQLSSRTPGEVRRRLIQWFYDLNKRGGAPRGMRDVCSGVKADCGYSMPLVKEHLTFLVDLNYIRREVTMTQVRTGQTVRDQPRVTYRIAAKGIEFMEGKSEFSDRERYPGINITATGGSTIVLGDGNVVNSTYRPVYDELSRFLQAVADSTELNDASKLEASVSIETIKDQLALPRPDRTIVEQAWATAAKLCTTATLADYAIRLGPMITAIFA
jgi:hypothetical protein